MSGAATIATAQRVGRQLRADRRTIAMVLVAPPGILALLDWVFSEQPSTMARVGPALVGLFVCAHDPARTETAIFSRVSLEPSAPAR